MIRNKKGHIYLNPRNSTWNLRIHPFGKENHLQNPTFSGSMLIFGGVYLFTFPIIMEVKNGCISKSSYLSNIAIFHFHDYGRKSKWCNWNPCFNFFIPQMFQIFESWGLGVCGNSFVYVVCDSLFLVRFTSQWKAWKFWLFFAFTRCWYRKTWLHDTLLCALFEDLYTVYSIYVILDVFWQLRLLC